MAENKRPMSSARVDPDRLSVLVDTTRMQLISPPPEEMLRPVSNPPPTTAAKRKRTQPATSTPLYSRDVNSTTHDIDFTTQQSMETTPNPKPRKQGRLHSRQPSLESPTETSFVHLRFSPKDDTSNKHTPSRSKTKTVLVESPHAKNPNADFIDVPALVLPTQRKTLLAARSSRRSATPIIPYEPPTDVFTPPREVFLSPVTKSSKRKSIASASSFKSAKGKKKGSRLTIVTAVKQELPDIDLTLPMPPPSPTDDPLLLLGPPELDFFFPDSEPTPPRKREMSVQVQPYDEDLPRSNGGWTDSDDEVERAGGMEGVDEGEGEYTGRWKTMLVRTKQDPPSSATRGRMEEWGKPISPFPKLALLEEEEDEEGLNHQHGGQQEEECKEEGHEEEVRWMSVEPEQLFENGEGQGAGQLSVESGHLMDLNEEEEEAAEEQEVRRMSVEPEQSLELELDEAEEQEVRRMSVEPEQSLELDEAEEQEVRRMSVEPEQSLELDEDEEAEEQEVRRISVEPEQSLELNEDEAEEQEVRRMSVEPEQLLENEEEEAEEQEVRQMSVEPEQLLENEEEKEGREVASPFDNLDRLPPQYPACENQAASCVPCRLDQEDDDQNSDDSDELDHGIVKITSADPRSAARAAAILKQHDYDCYTNIEIKRRHLEAKHRRKSDIEDSAKESRRRDVFSAGVAKVSSSRRRRRSTLSMGVIGDRVFIPGSPAITLPELLQEAELEVRDSPRCLSPLVLSARGDPFLTPIAPKYRVQTANVPMVDQKVEVYDGDIGEREWTKEDWKHLDACFTDQRLEVGSKLAGALGQDILASVDMISIDDVVDRFVVSKGGFETITSFGALWSRENLLERTRALQKKQRSGHIAPPTTPCTPLSVSSNSNDVLGGKDLRAPRMQVPDFTPLGRRAASPQKSRPSLPEFVPDQKGHAVIPPTLLAPRYSHLLEEAIAVSKQGSPGQEETFPQPEIEDPQSEVEETSHSSDVPSTTIGKRVKGLLFSYLPTLPKSFSTVSKKAPLSVQPGLPLPPIEILSKPRGPVITPARAPLVKPKHPKELVVLHPAPQPPTISHIPRLKKPQRLVELHPPAPIEPPTPIPRPRRSSGSSVKDLVRGFEEIQAVVSHDKLKYNVGWKTYTADKKRPHWKP